MKKKPLILDCCAACGMPFIYCAGGIEGHIALHYISKHTIWKRIKTIKEK